MRVNRAGQEERARKTDVVRPIGRGDDARDAPIRRVDGETCLHASASVDEIGKEAHRRWILPRPCVLPQYDAAYAQRGGGVALGGRPGSALSSRLLRNATRSTRSRTVICAP